MISSVRVRNYRSVSDSGRLPFGPVTLLVGPNNTGKSTLLRSLNLMQQGSLFEADDVRLRAEVVEVVCEVAAGTVFARHAHADPDVQRRPDLTAEVTASRSETQPKFRMTWDTGQAANSRAQLGNTRPNHVLVPVFARRRADGYDTTVRQDLAENVGLSDRYMSSRIAALTGDHLEAVRFREGLERVVGIRIGNHLTGQGQLPGRSLSAHEHIALS
ncbi:MAG: AAA family ATPase, partial [Mycobacteriales bacterium]